MIKKIVKTLSDDALTVHDLDVEEDNLSITQFPLYRNNSRHFVTQAPVGRRVAEMTHYRNSETRPSRLKAIF